MYQKPCRGFAARADLQRLSNINSIINTNIMIMFTTIAIIININNVTILFMACFRRVRLDADRKIPAPARASVEQQSLCRASPVQHWSSTGVVRTPVYSSMAATIDVSSVALHNCMNGITWHASFVVC